MKFSALPALFGVTLLGLAACVDNPSYPPVPPPRAEVMPNPPVTETPLIWEPGHYDWSGAGYIWVPGRYVERGTHGNLYMQGYWDRASNGSWAWLPAHWVP